ncbi:MAG: cyclic nucleotide-binding domain-containing protein [Acidobacteriota bacterium]|nr:cyclic nucleotide-binding domain-containing protein [Acidobacteriota bacterium]
MVTSAAPLTPTEARVLKVLACWPEARLAPTLRELAEALGWRTAAAVREYLGRLAARGLVAVAGGRARSIRLTEAGRSLIQPTHPPRRLEPPSDDLAAPQAVMRLLGAQARDVSLRKGGALWREGDPADRLVQVEHGLLRAYRSFDDGRTTTLLRFGPGDVLGFAPFFDGAGYPASVEALEASRVRVVHRRDLEAALKDPAVSMALLALLARRLRAAFDTIERLSIRSAVNRVAAALEPLVPGGAYPILTISGTGRAFAEGIGLTPASFSRAMAALVQHGVLHRLGPGKYQVIHLEVLRRLASGQESYGN